MLAGAMVAYLDAYPLNHYSMYGAVPLREIKSQLLALRRAGKLDRVKMLLLTNCTFDGIVYDVGRVMEECLAIKPDLVFLWDEAWFAFARFHPVYRPRTAMRAARTLAEKLRQPEYKAEYQKFLEEVGAIDAADDEVLLNRRLMPDPARARVRVYSTQSTHKTLTSLRQGSMIHQWDQDFSQKVEETFHEAYMTHTSTSPNYQILASLDLGRRQADLEGFELVQKQIENAMRLRDAVDHHPLLSKYMKCLTTADLIPAGLPVLGHRPAAALRPAEHDQGLGAGRVRPRPVEDHHLHRRHRHRRGPFQAQPPDGPLRRPDQQDLAEHRAVHDHDRHHPQLGGVPDRGARHHRPRPGEPGGGHEPERTGRPRAGRAAADLTLGPAARLQRLPPQLHRRPRARPPRRATCGGPSTWPTTTRTASTSSRRRSSSGWRTASRWCPPPTSRPYPPGYPVLVPGQVFSQQILAFMRGLDTPEIHGYRADLGYRVYVDKALEIAAPGANSRPEAAPETVRDATTSQATSSKAKRRTEAPRSTSE